MEKKYQTERRSSALRNLEKEKRLHFIIYLVSTFGLFLFLLVLYLRTKTIKANEELNRQKIIQLEQEKQLIAAQAVMVVRLPSAHDLPVTFTMAWVECSRL
jgi:heme/copper-type cytochrome/quinol oxidase subunit 3